MSSHRPPPQYPTLRRQRHKSGREGGISTTPASGSSTRSVCGTGAVPRGVMFPPAHHEQRWLRTPGRAWPHSVQLISAVLFLSPSPQSVASTSCDFAHLLAAWVPGAWWGPTAPMDTLPFKKKEFFQQKKNDLTHSLLNDDIFCEHCHILIFSQSFILLQPSSPLPTER